MPRTRSTKTQKAATKKLSTKSTKVTLKPPGESETLAARIIASAFADAQRTAAAHTRASKQLITAFNQSPSDFLVHFFHALNRILVIFSRDPPVERLIQFVAHFSASSSETIPNFCTTIISYLICHCTASTPAVRFRTVQLIASILIQLPADAELSEATLNKLQQAIFNRATDRVPRIRSATAGVLCRMQETGDPEIDPCTALLVSMLSTDASAAVRKAALQAIANTNETVPYVLQRIRDVSADVRRCAYETLATKVDPRNLHQDEICVVLCEGLKDRVKAVRTACRELLVVNGWMKRVCNGNVFEFVEILGCHDQEVEVLNALKVVFESNDFSKLVDATEIDVNNLKRDSVLVLRGLCEAKRGDGGVDKFIRSLIEYSKVLEYYVIDEFASKHLLELCKCVDMSDEAGRKILENTIRTTFLTGKLVSESVIPAAVCAMRRTMFDEESHLRLLIETVRHDILSTDEEDEQDEDDKDDEDADCSNSDGRSERDESKATEQYVNSNSHQLTENSEEQAWQRTRALNICLEALRTASRTTRSSALGTLYRNLVEVCVLPKKNSADDDMDVKLKVLECIGLFCMQDKSSIEAMQHMPLFIESAVSEEPKQQILAIKMLVDMLILFDFPSEQPQTTTDDTSPNNKHKTPCGLEADNVSVADDNNQSHRRQRRGSVKGSETQTVSFGKQCLKVLSNTLLNTDGEPRTTAAQGLARLLYVNRVVPDPELLACLLLVYHDPTTEDDADLRQCLSVFFPAFAGKSDKNRIALEKAFEPMCSKILDYSGDESDESSNISLAKAAQFVLDLTSPTGEERTSSDACNVGEPADEIHHRLAEWVLNEVINACARDDFEDAREYAKVLIGMNLLCTPSSNEHFQMLYKLVKYALSETTDRQLKRSLTRFSDRIYDELDKFDEETVDGVEDDDDAEEEASDEAEEEAMEKMLAEGEDDDDEEEEGDDRYGE